MLGENGAMRSIRVKEFSNVKDALTEHFNEKDYARWIRPLMRHLVDRLNKLVGDMKVYYVSPDELHSPPK